MYKILRQSVRISCIANKCLLLPMVVVSSSFQDHHHRDDDPRAQRELNSKEELENCIIVLIFADF